MFKCESILFPVEFSQRDEAAAPFVLSLAQRYHSRVFVMHVIQPPPPIYAGMNAVYPQVFDFEGAMEDFRIDLRRFASEQLPKVDTECVVELGDPAAIISQYACNNGMSLIAMPTHGYGVFRRALLGSVTAKVLHDSSLPVWTSAHTPEPTHRAHPKPRRILCALDMKPESLRTLETAMSIAKDAEATIELVHVPAETVPPEAAQRRLQELLAQVAQAEFLNVNDLPGLADQPEGERGSVAEAVRNLALHKRADLVIIGRGAIRRGLGRLYANSYDIIRESPCPVISV
jgi:nucleotide-binding universal stress UspA family protein